MLCMVGWFMCKRLFGPLSIHAVLVCMSYLPIYWSCPLALPLGLPCLRGLPLWVWLGWFGSLPPWFLFAVLVGPSLGCLRLWCGLGALASRCHGVVCSRWAFALGVDGVLPLWAGCCCCCCCCCCGCPLALRCLLGGSSDQSSHLLHVCQGLLPQCHRQRRTRSWDHGAVDGERTGTHSPSVCWSVPSNGQGWLDQFFINSQWDLSDLPNSFVPSPIYSSTSLIPFWSSQEPYCHTPHRQYPTNYVCVCFFPHYIYRSGIFSKPQKCVVTRKHVMLKTVVHQDFFSYPTGWQRHHHHQRIWKRFPRRNYESTFRSPWT